MDKKAYEHALRMMAPPRSVPLSCRLALMLNAGVQIGFFVLAFSTPFFWLFVANADLPSITFRGERMRTNGVVTEVVRTNASENKTRIWALHYSYSVAARQYEGVSYASGDQDLESGALVIVEYLKRDPSRSRIEGMRRGMFGLGVLFVLIFPAIGLGITLAALRYGMRKSAILCRGVTVFAKYKETRPTNMTVNKRPVFEVIHEYRTLEGELREASTSTTDVDSITDDAEEMLLYDPARRDSGVPVDSLTPLPELDEAGGFSGNLTGALVRLLFPAAVIAGNAFWLASKL
ncbi:MAG: DUF3592 domain-containing protein [Thermoanaerobaculia bacterium]|jgi:hypothetical protein